jgi:hypothetical protein
VRDQASARFVAAAWIRCWLAVLAAIVVVFSRASAGASNQTAAETSEVDFADVLLTKIDGRTAWSIDFQGYVTIDESRGVRYYSNPLRPAPDVVWIGKRRLQDKEALVLSAGTHTLSLVRTTTVQRSSRPDLYCEITFEAKAGRRHSVRPRGNDAVRVESNRRGDPAHAAECVQSAGELGARLAVRDLEAALDTVDTWPPWANPPDFTKLNEQNCEMCRFYALNLKNSRLIRNPVEAPPGVRWGADRVLQLSPGPHEISMRYFGARVYSISSCTIRFVAEHARTYAIRARATEQKGVFRTPTQWQGRIEDEATKQVVATCG